MSPASDIIRPYGPIEPGKWLHLHPARLASLLGQGQHPPVRLSK